MFPSVQLTKRIFGPDFVPIRQEAIIWTHEGTVDT